ncbi:MAG TPA: hypothetical protein VGC42_05090 [Kofleriaceae bacterium]
MAVMTCAAACGSKPVGPPAQTRPGDAGIGDAAPRIELDARPMGLGELAAFGWRKRGGQPAFRQARAAEERGDWREVVATCGQALAADPGHLEAAWLLAVGHAKLGELDRVVEPLAQAAAGDFGKWGPASLELPGMAPFLATPTGEAWRRRVEQDRGRYIAALARGLIVTAGGDLYAVEPEPGRWSRITRTSGLVIGALELPAAHQIAYVSRDAAARGALGVGVIDLATGRSSRPVPAGTAGPIWVAYSARPPVGVWLGTGAPRAIAWRQLDPDYKLHPLPPRTPRPAGPWLEVSARGQVRVHALPGNVTADWDDQSLASAIRIGTSNRVVSVPSPGLIDGNTAAWSPDRQHLAFVAQLDDHCAAGAVNTAAFVGDVATGGARELERAAGDIAVAWLSERQLAIAGDHGVHVVSLDGGAPRAIDGATGLVTLRERPRCAPPDARDAPPADDPEPVPADEAAAEDPAAGAADH